MKYSPISIGIAGEGHPLSLNTLIPPDDEHAQWGEFNREPASSSLEGISPEQLNQWIAKCKGKAETPQEQHRGLRRPKPSRNAKSAEKGKQSPDNQTSRPSSWKDWSELMSPLAILEIFVPTSPQ